jgi:hypothetical protein
MARASQGVVFSWSRVRMRSSEIAGVLGSVFGPMVSFWPATIRAYRRCTLSGGCTFCGALVGIPVMSWNQAP